MIRHDRYVFSRKYNFVIKIYFLAKFFLSFLEHEVSVGILSVWGYRRPAWIFLCEYKGLPMSNLERYELDISSGVLFYYEVVLIITHEFKLTPNGEKGMAVPRHFPVECQRRMS